MKLMNTKYLFSGGSVTQINDQQFFSQVKLGINYLVFEGETSVKKNKRKFYIYKGANGWWHRTRKRSAIKIHFYNH